MIEDYEEAKTNESILKNSFTNHKIEHKVFDKNNKINLNNDKIFPNWRDLLFMYIFLKPL